MRRKAMATTVAALLLALGCRRPIAEPRAELTGTWVNADARGFELRPDGTLALFNFPERSGLAWNVSHGELVLSTNRPRHPESQAARLALLKLEDDALELAGDDKELAGSYHRAQAKSVRGVLTYRERLALTPDARVEVRLLRGGAVVAQSVFTPRQQVPIPFSLAYLPSAGADESLAVDAQIFSGERVQFEAERPAPAPADGAELELLLRLAPH
jgi:putative lipoprotein